ncbi:hypothetical protein D3C87_162820 [compost metagenome]
MPKNVRDNPIASNTTIRTFNGGPALELVKGMKPCLKMNILAILISLGYGSTTFAQEKCSALLLQGDLSYLSEPWRDPEYQVYDGRLSAKALANANFSVARNILMMDNRPIGALKILSAKYLFQWASAEHHQGFLKYGANEGYIKASLQQTPQAAGRGFYVSKDPGDSTDYGSHLTAFRPKKPLVIVEFGSDAAHLANDLSIVENLAAIGIDGIRNSSYRLTWLSMIHHRNLGLGESLPPDALNGYWNPSQAKRYMNIDWVEKLPLTAIEAMDKDILIRRILLDEKYSFSEGLLFQRTYQNSLSASLRDKIVTNSMEKIKQANFTEVMQMYEMAINPHVIPREYLRMEEAQGPQLRYQALLDLYGLSEIAALKDLKTAGSKWKEMERNAERYITARKGLSLAKINTVQDLMTAAKKIYGHGFALRKKASLITYPNVYETQRITERQLFSWDTRSDSKLIDIYHWNFDGTIMSWFKILPSKIRAKLKPNASNKENITSEVLLNLVEQMIANPRAAGTSFVKEIARNEFKTARDFYDFFFALQPFESNNTQIGRLFFEVIREKLNSNEPDLAIPVQREQLNIGNSVDTTAMNVVDAWLREATSDAQFISRARQVDNHLLSRPGAPESTAQWSY